jgi:hypothetical protein
LITYCAYCRIPFLTYVSNKNRKDILCPYGCRDIHKRKKSQERVKKYRTTIMGKLKKKKLNENRYLNNEENTTEESDYDFLSEDDTQLSIYQYMWFIFKALTFDPENPGWIFRLYRFFKKIFKKRDNAP